MNEKELIEEYLVMENVSIDNMKILAKKYDITTKELISFLNQYNIETPEIFSRMKVIEMDSRADLKKKFINNQVSKAINLDKDVSVAVSIQKWFSDLGFDNKEKLEKKERVKVICYYYRTLGVDLFEEFCTWVENKIKNDRALTLENDLNGNFNISGENIESQIDSWMLEITKNILSEPEPELKEKMKKGSKIIGNVLGSVE